MSEKTNSSLSAWLKRKRDAKESILLDEGWDRLHKDGIQLLHAVLTGSDITRSPFSTTEYALLYNLTYTMSGHMSHEDYSLELYHRCKQSIETFLVAEMIPMLRNSEPSTAFEITQVAD